jgi:hypothetical protein
MDPKAQTGAGPVTNATNDVNCGAKAKMVVRVFRGLNEQRAGLGDLDLMSRTHVTCY